MNNTHSRKSWLICALLFFATTVNYMDRQVFGILGPTLQHALHWNDADYGMVVSAFSLAYGFGLLGFGRLIDRIGVKLGYTIAVIWWSIAAMGQVFAVVPLAFAACRFLLGLGQGGNFPAAIRTVNEWFKPEKRSFATGIFNAGSNMGAIGAALTVPIMSIYFGWRTTFIVIAVLSFIWLFFWLAIYPKQQHANSQTVEELKIPWLKLMKMRQTWALLVAKSLTDCVWWFYLYWLPSFFYHHNHVKLLGLTLPIFFIYLLSDFGSILGGGLATVLYRRYQDLGKARMRALLVCAFAVLPVLSTPYWHSTVIIVILIGLGAAAHQGWSANVFTLPSDLFPRHWVASLTGLAGFVSGIVSALFQSLTGIYLQWSHDQYWGIFIYCGLAYLITWCLIKLIMPNFCSIDENPKNFEYATTT